MDRRLNSREKLEALISGTAGADEVAGDPEMGQLLGVMRMAAPVAMRFLPSDPDELDAMLITGASLALRLRSDDADPPESLLALIGETELLDGEAEEVYEHEVPEWDQ